jgi:hypothetical protein
MSVMFYILCVHVIPIVFIIVFLVSCITAELSTLRLHGYNALGMACVRVMGACSNCSFSSGYRGMGTVACAGSFVWQSMSLAWPVSGPWGRSSSSMASQVAFCPWHGLLQGHGGSLVISGHVSVTMPLDQQLGLSGSASGLLPLCVICFRPTEAGEHSAA